MPLVAPRRSSFGPRTLLESPRGDPDWLTPVIHVRGVERNFLSLTCREYLVTSPAVRCWDPRPGSIEPVPVPLKLSTLLYCCFGDGIGNQTTR